MEGHWKLSEHIGIVAPTGFGKSWIARDLLGMKKYGVVVATKSKDKTLDRYIKEDGFVKRDTWPADWYQTHVVLWKKAKELGNYQEQQALIYFLMNDLYQRGGYVLYFDDLYYVSETLKLRKPVQMLYTQVRSNGVSLIASMQRPTWVPLEAVSQSTFIICFGIRDRRDIQRVAEGTGQDYRALETIIDSLQQYEFLLIEQGRDILHVGKRPM
jgi:hypothetical protein